ncbi:MMPL family transporter [Nocardioides campestrisoli]|uniref:MMPL family transporter n=1 Tax=Nocardioides campestrisoli TaxID=2736757 RepID=UPI0015E6BF74|nr:MMPL family transporter [Nocardioides campestrisoli]
MPQMLTSRLTGPVSKWVVLGLWILVTVGSSVLASRLVDVQNNETSSWLPESAESTRALAETEEFRDPDAIPTVVVYVKDSGLARTDMAAAQADAKEFAALDHVEGEVVGPIPSKDGEVMQTIVTFDYGSEGWELMPGIADDLHEIAALDGGDVYIAGPGGQAADSAEAFGGIDTTLLFSTLGVVIVILLLTYRSPVLWLLPILCAGVALFGSQALVYLLVRFADLTVNGQSYAILTILVIGAGTDYALLLVARYREELRRHEDRHEAMAFALRRAAPAILASALTVTLGMLCLVFAEMNSTAGLGPVAAVGIVVTFLVQVTLLPALLVISGRWIFWPRVPSYGSPEPTRTGLWARVGHRISRRPRVVWVSTTVLLGVACLGLFRLDASGLSTEDTYTQEIESVTGQQLLAAHGLLDESNTVQVVSSSAQAGEVRTAMSDIDGLGPPDRPTVHGETAYVQAVIAHDVSSPQSFAVVEQVRDATHAVPEADALVGGGSAAFLDIREASTRDNWVIIPVILVMVLLILMVLLRAVLAPLILVATVVLSFGAAMGISAVLFEYVFGFEGSDPSFPLFAFVFLVALGIDYNIFLMTRVREETKHSGTREGSLYALTTTGGVITSAGLVLAATFLVLGTIPVVFLAELGVAVALGVILDTMVVRSVLVTAINLDLGGRIWWPSRLDRPGPPPEPDLAPTGGGAGTP